MKATPELIRRLPNLDKLAQQLEEAPEKIISRGFPAEDPRLAERPPMAAPAAGLEMAGAGERDLFAPVDRISEEPWVRAGTRAVKKLRDEGEGAELTPEEATGLEAIVALTGRPAILIQNDRFFEPPDDWKVLDDYRAAIETTCRSVGRVELSGHPSLDWVGTGFLVADTVVMTNRHVAEVFSQMGNRKKWSFKVGMTARIDYVEELGAAAPAEFAFRSVIGVHETFDLALFRVSRTSSTMAARPKPLTLASQFAHAEQGRQVYVVGYPAWDGRRNDPQPMLRIFANIFNVKRLQPGEIDSAPDERHVFVHDCSTLGGNSGSPVVDLETNQVIGLHFGGRYLQGNSAIALWQLTTDPLLKKARVHFA